MNSSSASSKNSVDQADKTILYYKEKVKVKRKELKIVKNSLDDYMKKFKDYDEKMIASQKMMENTEKLINSVQTELNAKIDTLREDLEKEKTANKELRELNNNLLKRNNLEFFLRAFYSIPFWFRISNKSHILNFLFEDIKLNLTNNRNKTKKEDLVIRAMHKVSFGKLIVNSESNTTVLSSQGSQIADATTERDIFFLANEDHLREIVFNLLKVCKENKIDLIKISETLKKSNHFYINEHSGMGIIIDEVKTLFSNLC